MRLSFKKIWYPAIILLVLGFVVFNIVRIYNSVQNALADERARLFEQNRVPFEKEVLTPHSSQNVRILQITNTVREPYIAATSCGVILLERLL